MSFKDWVDEFFFNSSVDLEILRKAYNAIASKEMHVNSDSTISRIIMTKKNLLVIGATGFVGRRFCQYLLDQNYDKKLNLKFSARNKEKFKKIFSLEEGDRFEFRELDTLNNFK